MILSSTLSAAALAPAETPPPVVASSGGAATAPAPSAHHRRKARPLRLVVAHRDHEAHAGGVVIVRGTLLPRHHGRRIVVEGALHGHWRPLGAARTRANGHFGARIVAGGVGTIRLRVRAGGGRSGHVRHAAAGTLRSYRPTLASWYALYGSPLACGGTLGYGTLGVANKTLPCGTKVTLRYHGRRVTVRVVDRGPYSGAREWDLTGATARRLGFDGVGTVWSTR